MVWTMTKVQISSAFPLSPTPVPLPCRRAGYVGALWAAIAAQHTFPGDLSAPRGRYQTSGVSEAKTGHNAVASHRAAASVISETWEPTCLPSSRGGLDFHVCWFLQCQPGAWQTRFPSLSLLLQGATPHGRSALVGELARVRLLPAGKARALCQKSGWRAAPGDRDSTACPPGQMGSRGSWREPGGLFRVTTGETINGGNCENKEILLMLVIIN